jgi:hypothetical protein
MENLLGDTAIPHVGQGRFRDFDLRATLSLEAIASSHDKESDKEKQNEHDKHRPIPIVHQCFLSLVSTA